MKNNKGLKILAAIVFPLIMIGSGFLIIDILSPSADPNNLGTLAPIDTAAATCLPGVTECDRQGRSYCGHSCNSDIDCIPTGANGSPTKCNNGRCESANCPVGATARGRNCDCMDGSGVCGDRCGGGYPLCGEGSICTYIGGPSCTEMNASQEIYTTFCVPYRDIRSLGYQRENCVDRDTYNSYLLGPNEETEFTVEQILGFCELDLTEEPPTTPPPTIPNTPNPNPTPTSPPPPAQPPTVVDVPQAACNDGIDNDGDGRIDCTVGNSDPGCYPNGRGGGGACNPNDNSEIDAAELPRTNINDNYAFLFLGVFIITMGVAIYRLKPRR